MTGTGEPVPPAIVYDRDVDLSPLLERRIAIIGYGSQGHAHALNLRDSGCQVRIGLRAESSSAASARAAGFRVETIADAADGADLIAIMLPDQYHRTVFESDIRDHLAPGKMLLFAHGFSVRYGEVVPPQDVDVVLVAPVSPGHTLRRLYTEGEGPPAVYAVRQDASGLADGLARAYAKAIGCTRAGAIRSSFEEETETDLFGEQAVLCGGLPDLIRAGFETLVEAGYRPELAYFECVHQVKLIVDLIYQGGLDYLYARISDTAEFGAYRAGPQIIGEAARAGMRDVLHDVQDGSFARAWIADYGAGMPELRRERSRHADGAIEEVGRRLRAQMGGADSYRASSSCRNASDSSSSLIEDP